MVINTIQDSGRAAIERLRTKTPNRSTPVTLSQATNLVAMIIEGHHSLDVIAARLAASREATIELVVELGTWLGQSLNAGAKAKVVSYDKAPMADGPEDENGQLHFGLFKRSTEDIVVLPPGFDRRAADRDLSKAVSQIVRGTPDEAMLRRYLMRRYHRIHQVLGFDTVALVHRLAQVGRLSEVDQLAERSVGFNVELARLLVEAYDLLDVARQDAVGVVENFLAQLESTGVDHDQITKLVSEAGWLHQAEFGRLTQAVAESGNPLRLEAALAQFRRAANLSPSTFRPSLVADLNDGQVRLLCLREGLSLDGAQHTEADQVRTWVAEAGLSADADLLVADGIRASRAGLGEVFRAALERRSAGDLAWSEEINGALAQVARV